MMKKHAVVVGAGAGGLTTALRLLRNGWDVTVYEKNHEPGGRLGRLQGKGYTFDLGPTIVLMPDVFEKLFADLGRDLRDYVTMRPLYPNYRLHFGDGSFLDSTSDLQTMMRELTRVFPDDVEGFMRYIGDMYKRYRIARYDFIEQPMLSTRELLHPGRLWKLLQLRTLNSMHRDISRYIKDERLRTALTFQSLYIGIDPFQAPSIYNVIGYMELSYSGVWYCEGGYHAIAQALCNVLSEMGGTLHLRSAVKEVLFDGKRATGIRLDNGDVVHADAVIVNADFPQAAQTLLPSNAKGRFRAEKAAKLEQSCSAFMLYLGVARQYTHAQVHNVYFARDFQKSVEDIFARKVVPDDFSMYVHVPSLIDPSVAPPGKQGIYVLVPVPNLTGQTDWASARKTLRDQIVRRLEAHGFEGLEEAIEFEAVYTPDNWRTGFGLQDGAAFGVMPKLLQSAYWRPSLKSDAYDGLYFVGASTHPGGGIPIVMTGAKILEGIIARDYPGTMEAYHVARNAQRGARAARAGVANEGTSL